MKSLDHEGRRNAGQYKKKTVNGYAVFNNEKIHKYFNKGGDNENKYFDVEINIYQLVF